MIPVFRAFGLSHLLVIGLSLLIVAVVYITQKWHIKNQNLISKTIGFTGLIFFPVHLLVYVFVVKTFDVRYDLPILQICGITLFSSCIFLLSKNIKLKSFFYNIVFFWGISALITSFLTPALKEDFPHIYFWLFWVSHWLLVYILSFVFIAYPKKLSYLNLWQSVGVFLVFLSLIYPFNLATNSNYAFLISKPELIHFGVVAGIDFDQSPNYILPAILLGVAVFHLVYFCNRLLTLKSTKQKI